MNFTVKSVGLFKSSVPETSMTGQLMFSTGVIAEYLETVVGFM